MDNLYESSDILVSHPSHYQSESGLEVIDVIEAFTDDLTGIFATDTGNCIKYSCRWHKKNGLQDVEKAIWYATHLLNKLYKSEFKRKPKALTGISTRDVMYEYTKDIHDAAAKELSMGLVDLILNWTNENDIRLFIKYAEMLKLLLEGESNELN